MTIPSQMLATNASDRGLCATLHGADSPAARWFVQQLLHVPRLAHHPTCRCFDNHLIRLGSIALCLGCTCMAFGVGTCLTTLGWLCWQHWQNLQMIGTSGFIVIGVVLYAPALIQPFVQRKMFKMVSRFLLGVAVPCLWFGAMVLLPWDGWGFLLRGIFVIIFWQTYHATQRVRDRFTSNPCDACPDGVFPFCKDNHERLVALFRELQARARPDDQEFVDFAAALAGLNSNNVNIEVVSMRTVFESSDQGR